MTSECAQEAIRDNKSRDREVLAATLTRLRNKPAHLASTAFTDGYRYALDAVAEAQGIHAETTVTVRYIA
jgi:hypothetical protein